MERRTALLLLVIALVAYGVYHASYAVTMLLAPASPLLLLAFALQAALAILAAVGVWRYALLIAIAAIVVALLLGVYVNRSGPTLDRRPESPPT